MSYKHKFLLWAVLYAVGDGGMKAFLFSRESRKEDRHANDHTSVCAQNNLGSPWLEHQSRCFGLGYGLSFPN